MSAPMPPRSDRLARLVGTRRHVLIVALVIAVLTISFTLAGIIGHVRAGTALTMGFVSERILWLVLGLGVAVVLFALSTLAQCAQSLQSCVAELERISSETRAAAGNTSERGSDVQSDTVHEQQEVLARLRAACDEMLVILHDVRDNSLLSEEQRREKAVRVEQQELAEAAARIERLTDDGDFARANQLLDECTQRYPGRPALTTMAEKIEQRREQREHADVREFNRRVDDFINISAWERARGVAEELRRRHPDSPAVVQLESRIDREYQLYEDAQCRQMYAEIQRYVSRRRWSEALAAAETFIERFPQRGETEALQLQLPTLSNNAEVTARQEMDTEITELAKRGQYAEAEALADSLIRRWPDSPQAEVLRSQLSRLHELATNPNAPPPRVRPSNVT